MRPPTSGRWSFNFSLNPADVDILRSFSIAGRTEVQLELTTSTRFPRARQSKTAQGRGRVFCRLKLKNHRYETGGFETNAKAKDLLLILALLLNLGR